MTIRLMVGTWTAMLMCSACERVEVADERHGEDAEAKTIVAHVGGMVWNWDDATRVIEANGETLKELWVFDVVGDSCVLICKQTEAQDEFGTVSMRLRYGSHKLAFVCSRGEGSAVDEKSGRIEWTKVRDTFYKSIVIDVVKGGESDMEIVLSRVVARMRVTIADVITSDVKRLRLSADCWYKGIDVKNGEAISGLSSGEGVAEVSSVNVPAAYVGTSKKLAVSMWTIGKSEQWTQTLKVEVLNGDDEVIGGGDCVGVPMQRNRVTNVTGYFLSGGKNGNILVDDSWSDVIDYEF